MKIEENSFFRNVTKKILGSLKIEQSLLETYRYLKQFLPVDQIYIQKWDQNYEALRFVASADDSGARRMNTLTSLPEDVKKIIMKVFKDKFYEKEVLHLYEEPMTHPISSSIYEST